MQSELRRYVPCLRWKQGEYQALLHLSPEMRDAIVPLIEVAEIGFDFETREPCKSIDKHLNAFAKRMLDKWGQRNCFVDMKLIGPCERMADGKHPAAFVFDDLRSKGILAIPTLNLRQDTGLRAAIKEASDKDGRGVCLRVRLEEAGNPHIRSSVDKLLSSVGTMAEQCDFILDMEAPNFEPLDGLAGLLEILVSGLPHLDSWRSIGLIGTSFPASMAELPMGLSTVRRSEWQLYKNLAVRLARQGLRLPSFGDYVISHPAVALMYMRFVKPSASLRYTVDDGWLSQEAPMSGTTSSSNTEDSVRRLWIPDPMGDRHSRLAIST